MLMSRTGAPLALVLLCTLACLATGADAVRRLSLFDPLFAADEDEAAAVVPQSADTHTVAAGPAKPRNLLEIRNADARSTSESLPPLIGDEAEIKAAIVPAQSSTSTSTSSRFLNGANPKQIENSVSWSSPSPGSTSATLSNVKRHLADGLPTASHTRRPTDKPEHWSALTSYYETLANAAKANERPGLPTYQLSPYYNENQQPNYVESYEQEGNFYDTIRANERLHRPAANGQANAEPIPPFLQNAPVETLPWHFPIQQEFQGTKGLPQSNVSPSKQHSVPMVVNVPEASRGSPQATKTAPGTSYKPQLPTCQESTGIQSKEAEQIPNFFISSDLERSRASAEVRKRLELDHRRRLEHLSKHQDDLLGPLLKSYRIREQLQAESYCGQRNRVANGDMSQLLAVDSVKGLSAGKLRELLAAVSPGDYPSHMGLYNGTSTDDASFLCGATWVHERFALTLASCIPRKLAPNLDPQLTVRAGEWFALKTNDSVKQQSYGASQMQPTSFTRRVLNVHPFPKYLTNNSGEHNLALVEWSEPEGSLVSRNYSLITPACPIQARQALPARATCWTPVRNITLSEYFDAEGEGETKLKRNLAMQELPVKLYNDDAECKRETQLDLFNFQQPNYICSADVKRTAWRLRLNQTENFGSAIYCNDAGRLSLVSIVHPLYLNSASQFGYLDLAYYRPWMQDIIAASASI